MPSTPTVRQWLLLTALSHRHFGATFRELAQELNVGEKTIRRDLDLLQSVGFPLEEEVGARGRKTWRLAAGNGQPPGIGFAYDEALALYLGRRFLDPLSGTFLGEAADRALAKVRASLGRNALRYLDKMADRIHLTAVGAGDYAGHRDVIDALERGVDEEKATIIVYRSLRATEPVEHEVFPFGLARHRGSLYLVARSRDHDEEIRHFKVDRIERADVTGFPFHRPADFDLAIHFEKSFGVFHGDGDVRVVVQFMPPVVRYVQEARWHKSQKLTKQKDGGLLSEFRLSTTEEIKHWIMSFGRQAIVLAPSELRREIADEAKAILEAYGVIGSREDETRDGARTKHSRRIQPRESDR
jgi:predicted DNA-binding transcriptional regulator YafY